MVRDFTYVDDIVEGVVACRPAGDPTRDPSPHQRVPWRIFNIGNNQRVELMRYIEAIEAALGKKAKLELLPMQAGDVRGHRGRHLGARARPRASSPHTPVEEGVRRFVEWYREYYKA